MVWNIATWVIVIVGLLAFLAEYESFRSAQPGSRERRRAKEAIDYDIPMAWRYALMLLLALYCFRFWRRGLMTQFNITNGWSWPLAVTGLLVLVALTGGALATPRVRWWWLMLLWGAAIGGAWLFVWVVSHGGYVPMNKK